MAFASKCEVKAEGYGGGGNEELREDRGGKGWLKTKCVGKGHNEHHYFV